MALGTELRYDVAGCDNLKVDKGNQQAGYHTHTLRNQQAGVDEVEKQKTGFELVDGQASKQHLRFRISGQARSGGSRVTSCGVVGRA